MPVREVAFELECFEWADERLEVAGRWKGLAGRRLARPVLTLDTESGKRKRLVALPGGHFGAAAESWRTAFDWPGDPAEITGAELEVGGNIVVDLPLPDRRRRRRRRPPVDPGDEALRAEIVALRAQLERLRAELAGRERENIQLRAQIDEDDGDKPVGAAGSPTVEIERLTGEQAQMTAEIERLAQERDRTRAELSSEIERLRGEQERWKAEIDQLREAFSEAAAEAEESRDRHRAEVVRLENELRSERAAVARLSAELSERPELPPPATGSARQAAATPPTQALPAPDAPDDETTQAMPAPEDAGDDDAAASAESTQPMRAIVDAASLPGALDPPGPMRAGARPATHPGGEERAGSSRIPAWLRSRDAERSDDAGPGPSAAAFAADDAGEDAGAGAQRTPSPALQALKERLGHLLVPNGHASAEHDEGDLGVPRPRRTATAARARAGTTLAARRSLAELWALRILAVALVAVLLIAFLLILTRVA